MEIALGLPTSGTPNAGRSMVHWATRAEDAGFSSLAVIDRIVYDNLDPLMVLAAAAGATARIGLLTSVLIAPARPQALLFKETATLDRLAGPGRLTLGMAVGARADDYHATGASFGHRGRSLDSAIAAMRGDWAGVVGPAPVTQSGPRLLVGGMASAAVARVGSVDGWVAGAGGPRSFEAGAPMARASWESAGRPGEPHLVGMAYVALGPDGDLRSREVVGGYYGFLGAEIADRILAATNRSPGDVRATVKAFEDLGCDEVVLMACDDDDSELERIIDAVL